MKKLVAYGIAEGFRSWLSDMENIWVCACGEYGRRQARARSRISTRACWPKQANLWSRFLRDNWNSSATWTSETDGPPPFYHSSKLMRSLDSTRPSLQRASQKEGRTVWLTQVSVAARKKGGYPILHVLAEILHYCSKIKDEPVQAKI